MPPRFYLRQKKSGVQISTRRTAILNLGRTFGPYPSFRQGTPASSHRDVNLNLKTDPDQVSITPMARVSGGTRRFRRRIGLTVKKQAGRWDIGRPEFNFLPSSVGEDQGAGVASLPFRLFLSDNSLT